MYEEAYVHSHGGKDSNYQSEVYSYEDIELSNNYKKDLYLLTPSGHLYFYQTGTVNHYKMNKNDTHSGIYVTGGFYNG